MTVVTLERRPTPDEAAPVLASVLSEECAWLAGNAVNNRMPPAGDLLSPVAQHSRRERLDAQRSRVGRIPIAMLVYSVSLEQIDPARARATRGYANTFGGVAGFLGDDNGIGVMSDARHELLLRNLARVAAEAECLRARPFMSQELERMLVALSQHYFGAGS